MRRILKKENTQSHRRRKISPKCQEDRVMAAPKKTTVFSHPSNTDLLCFFRYLQVQESTGKKKEERNKKQKKAKDGDEENRKMKRSNEK